MRKTEVNVTGEPQREYALRLIREADIENHPIKVTIEDYVKKRTNSQMRLYFMWLSEVAKLVSSETGMSTEDFHEAVKKKFLSPRVFEFAGRFYEAYSTKGLDVKQMSNYLDQIYQLIVGDFGITLPLPEEFGRQ